MLTINTNVASLNAQRNLSGSQNALSTTLQRLSSGLRINSAKDDAAGLAISERMSSQIRGMDQARRNANDGISMAQTAEGALSSSGDILQRIRELAVQSSNSSNSATDRQALQSEVGQLTSELDRIAQTTEFNGQKLLDGTSGSLTYQVGANAGQTITATGTNFRTSNYGNNSVTATAPAVKAFAGAATNPITAAKTIKIDGGLGSYTTTATTATSSAQSVAAEINANTAKTGVTASATTTANVALQGGKNYTLTLQSDNATAVTVAVSMGATATSSDDYAGAINAINAQTGKTGVIAEYDSANGGIKLTNQNGNNITLGSTAASTGTVTVDTYKSTGALLGSAQASTAGTAGDTMIAGQLSLNSDKSFGITDTGTGLTSDDAAAAITNSSLDSVQSLDISSFAGAQKALKIVDSALQSINGQRAQFGALQSRFENTISNLQTSSENLSASRSRIQDADFASETAKLTKNQVLQQAGTAMLAQANQLPQGVLSLLR
ncbi:flagellin [Vogesella oryzae]|uniref:flagellin n=1 Tax=Vogesella oryzae TaxID=1735285 RepID=UPI0015828028|nr:flagellin [Vogesella oryzae]